MTDEHAELYDREGVAARVVEVTPAAGWAVTPNTYEGEQ